MKRKSGFTLIELMIVIAIIAIFLATLMPAIYQACEANRRTGCAKNLKDVSLGMLIYHDSHRGFPSVGRNKRWSVEILPHLEETALYEQYDERSAPDSTSNLDFGVMIPPWLKCPSENEEREPSSQRIASHQSANFLMLENSLKKCTDGPSKTALVVELRSSNLIPWPEGPARHVGPLDSAHGVMVNIAFADGHVKLVNGDDEDFMAAIGTPDGREILSPMD